MPEPLLHHLGMHPRGERESGPRVTGCRVRSQRRDACLYREPFRGPGERVRVDHPAQLVGEDEIEGLPGQTSRITADPTGR